MKRVYDFLKKASVYYLATVEGDQPRVRPFGTINEFEGKLYIQTGKVKPTLPQNSLPPIQRQRSVRLLTARGFALHANLLKTTALKQRNRCLILIPTSEVCTTKTTETPRCFI